MDLAIPFEVPSTRGPGSARGLVRDTLKELRQGRGEELRAIRALSEYSHSRMEGGEWRLPWTSPSKKTQLSAEDEPRMVAIASVLFMSRLVNASYQQNDYKRAQAHAVQAIKLLKLSGDSPHFDLSQQSVDTLRAVFAGIAHQLVVLKLLSSGERPAKASATVHARVAMYAQDQFSSAIQTAHKALRAWLETNRAYCLAACHFLCGCQQLAENQPGVAIAHFRLARNSPAIALAAQQSIAEAESANRFVAFQAVPEAHTLGLPAGRCVIDFSSSEYF